MRKVLKLLVVGTAIMTLLLATMFGTARRRNTPRSVRLRVGGSDVPTAGLTNDTAVVSSADHRRRRKEFDDVLVKPEVNIASPLSSEVDQPLLLLSSNITGNRALCVRTFLTEYERYCHRFLRPHPSNVPDRWRPTTKNGTIVDESLLCACVPSGLLGFRSQVHDSKQPTYAVKSIFLARNVTGGRWYPRYCIARHRIAIIIPFRNRDKHLRRLLHGLHQVLQRQQLDYTIFVINQLEPPRFNRASLLNVGFVEAKKVGHFDCFFVHDVDMIPKDDRNFYTCSPTPRHVSQYRDTHRAKNYDAYFGGVVAISARHFERINGLSNQYYGWGGEDDDFRHRLIISQIPISSRFPQCISVFANMRHFRDKGNPTGNRDERRRYLHLPEHRLTSSGLWNVRYTVASHEQLLMYTKISVNLTPKRTWKRKH